MKEYKQLGAYGLIIKDKKIVLIKKSGGPYDGKLDLPGGTIEFCEKPEDALKRELLEEVGIKVKDFKLLDADSISFDWQFKEDILLKVHIFNYDNEIKQEINVDEINDDSMGADFYDISKLTKNDLSAIAILELEKLGYELK